MKIIITGATGSLGAYLTRHFSDKGHEIIASGRDKVPPKNLLNYAEYFQADINHAFQFPEADICIHAAALSDDKGAWKNFYEANVSGTENVLNASAACKTFIQVSTSAVYLPENELIAESVAGKQNNKLLSNYGKSKLLSEEVILEKSKHEKCFILRPRALYGIGDKKILPRMLHLVKKDKIMTPGKMLVDISMTQYKNFAYAVECCMESSLTGIHTYNVADDRSYLLIDALRGFTKEIYGKRLPEKQISINFLKLMAFFHLGGMTPLLIRSLTKNMVLDISKIKKELNYQAQMELENSLEELGNWVRKIGGAEILKQAEKSLAWEI